MESGIMEGEGNGVKRLMDLVNRLLAEHQSFSMETRSIGQSIGNNSNFARITEVFVPLREALIEHMLVEESEIFPEVSRRGLFTERVSEIMQQHLSITASLENMRYSLHGKSLESLKSAFGELSSVMMLHFAEEEVEVFSIIS